MSQNPHPEPRPAIHHRYRGDGWTPDVQRKFIDALAACGSVAEACRVVNRSASTAYRLRAKPAAKSFRDAWTAAQGMAYRQVFEMAMDRYVIGTEQPIYHKGEQVGFKTTHSDRLLCFLLTHLKPAEPVPTSPLPAHHDAHDFALAEAVSVMEFDELDDDADSSEAREAFFDESEALEDWRETIEGEVAARTSRAPADAPWFDDEPSSSAAPPATPASGDPSYAPFPTGDDLRAMTPEERDAFEREEEAAFQETVRLGRSVGIDLGSRNGDSGARALLSGDLPAGG